MRTPMARSLAALAALMAALCTTAAAPAQEDEGFDKNLDDSLSAEKQAADEKTSEKMPGEKDKPPPPDEPTDNDPFEKEGQAYRFIGLRFRNFIVPQFMINLFADGGATVNVFTFGPEFTTRKDGLEIDFAFSYADYSMDPFLFKGKSDDDDAWEIVSSDMKLLYLTVDLLYEIPIDKEKGRFSLLVGGGVGIGFVLGNLYRNQAAPDDPTNLNTEDVNAWRKCEFQGDSPPFCDSSNEHYGSYDEPSWFNGGSKPSVFPYIALPQLSFRFKPIKQLQTRFDTGFSISGFFLGLSAGYGL